MFKTQPSLWDGRLDEEAICCAECGFRHGHSADCHRDFFPAALGCFEDGEGRTVEEGGLAPIHFFLRQSAFSVFASWDMEPHFPAFLEGNITVGYVSPAYRKGLK